MGDSNTKRQFQQKNNNFSHDSLYHAFSFCIIVLFPVSASSAADPVW